MPTSIEISHTIPAHPRNLHLDFPGKKPIGADELVERIECLTEAELEGDQDLCWEIKNLEVPWKILCGCDERIEARLTIRRPSLDKQPEDASARPKLKVVCCGARSMHGESCNRHSTSAFSLSPIQNIGGKEFHHIAPSLVHRDKAHAAVTEPDEEDFITTPSGEKKPRGSSLREFLLRRYEVTALNVYPKSSGDPFRTGFHDLFLNLQQTGIGNPSTPRGICEFGDIAVLPEIQSRTRDKILANAKAGKTSVVISRFESVRMASDKELVEFTLKGASEQPFLLTRKHWERLLLRYHRLSPYLESGFHIVMIFTTAPVRAADPNTKIFAKNLTWIPVTEDNIPIDSREEGFELRCLKEAKKKFRKPLRSERDINGVQRPRRDVEVLSGNQVEFEIEIFAMGIESYLADIPRRSKPGSVPLLCVLYSRGDFVERYWAFEGPRTAKAKLLLGLPEHP